MTSPTRRNLAFLGATGRMGFALAVAHARAGHDVIIGSRTAARAEEAAAKAKQQLMAWQALVHPLQQLAPHLAGKVVVDCTNIGYLVGEESWGQTSSLLLNMAAAAGVAIKWACAWKHVPWTLLEAGGCPDNPWSVMVCADDAEAKAAVMQLTNSLGGFKALDAGGVAESKVVELIGPNWLFTLMEKNFASAEGFPAWRFGM
ncbi:hypothetical protein COO60DRAFT_1501033 [Scenedesmus sp. NREL 46B-D3]|nr:hypothetical protein COO60DRAFT_1501033 [Scenedesmus sp. NREL 46B-D3]